MPEAARLRAERLRQLQAMAPGEIERIVGTMRQATSVPALAYHVSKHRNVMQLRDARDYLAQFAAHVERDDLRVFTYLRASDRTPLWGLVAAMTGATLMYKEQRRAVWSFFGPSDGNARMKSFEGEWVEVVRVPGVWRFLEEWRWQT